VPEGPEIRRAADAVAAVLVGREIVAAECTLRGLKKLARSVTGASVTAVETRGKAMLTRFDNGLTLYSHNQLYGRWYTLRRPGLPATQRQLRVALHTATHSALLYSATDIQLLGEDELGRHPFLRRAGPDILDPGLTAEQVAKRLVAKPFVNRALSGLYLDQSFLAGIGNYLRSEILWAARVDPAARPAELGAVSLRRLARETLRISRRSYRTRGVTAPPAAVKLRRREGMSFEGYRFQVYDREGLDCYACGTPVERLSAGSRALFVCRGCQPD
jgi:endonuclease-8